jgi:hypothetical protein
VSTDTARIALRYNSGAGGRDRWEFTPYFTIRPDPAIGDAPPAIALQLPLPGQSFPGASVVPISWTASDDESLRSFEIQASFDAGRTWHTVAANLPATARSFSWRLPPSTGIPDSRIRVLARDLRFQSTSVSTPIAILPGISCPADFNGDGALAVQDIFDFLTAWFAGSATADFSGGGLSVQDIFDYLAAWFTGCA